MVQYLHAAICSGGDVLQEGNAELSSEVNQHWTFTGSGTNATTVHSKFTVDNSG